MDLKTAHFIYKVKKKFSLYPEIFSTEWTEENFYVYKKQGLEQMQNNDVKHKLVENEMNKYNRI